MQSMIRRDRMLRRARLIVFDRIHRALELARTVVAPDWRIGALVRFLANPMRPGKPAILALESVREEVGGHHRSLWDEGERRLCREPAALQKW